MTWLQAPPVTAAAAVVGSLARGLQPSPLAVVVLQRVAEVVARGAELVMALGQEPLDRDAAPARGVEQPPDYLCEKAGVSDPEH